MQALRSNMGDASLVKSACGLVRQLANSDELKEATIEAGGLELLNRAVAMHSASPATIEQVPSRSLIGAGHPRSQGMSST